MPDLVVVDASVAAKWYFLHELAPLPDPISAFAAARRFNRTLIDCLYLTLAEEHGCDFWTDDRKLVRTLSASYPWVRWVGDYPSSAPASP